MPLTLQRSKQQQRRAICHCELSSSPNRSCVTSMTVGWFWFGQTATWLGGLMNCHRIFPPLSIAYAAPFGLARGTLPPSQWPLLAAGSTGRRNTGVKFLCRGFKSQGLAWPLIELAGHFVEMGLRVHRQVGSFRKILSQQAIGVLVGTALPWTLRIAKVNIDVGR